ncbi:P-loop containing nucleoside triphosphate hydrolase protein [Fimicolochytrium jonesii]|uniref:P-loop containing nucleoside triphosphate hydrolase protein n=1 Tax=Fimicolochytrium jonesii TaxID=1396493 RepID=UPI0022FE1EFB|nr:P-loop containing nucleoside triphosphate hydrolase protein [Fimicolochytrium jonesii]KAI8817989.1 P-loop containing nucleoside triphosphate hydrolase protein [Fimicolochytrium jonesii]
MAQYHPHPDVHHQQPLTIATNFQQPPPFAQGPATDTNTPRSALIASPASFAGSIDSFGTSGFRSGFSTNAPSSAFTSASGKEDGEERIRVVVRVRPLTQAEKILPDNGGVECFDDHRTLEVSGPSTPARTMTFNRVYSPTSTQEEVFDDCGAKEMIIKAIEGYYQHLGTGSGKSYTMTGEIGHELNPPTSGLVLRGLQFLFEQLNGPYAEKLGGKTLIRAGYLEIYNEHVQDLLSLTNTTSLPVRYDASKGFYVENSLVVDCASVDDSIAVLQEGLRNRTTRAHQLNEHSSRSHSIMTLYIETETESEGGGEVVKRHGKISFVDLAGSEKVRDSKATGTTFTETTNINKSLLTLGTVISLLSHPTHAANSTHIPYRNSLLTRLLASSLSGTGLALMIATISPSPRQVGETMKTLRYAQRAKRIRTRAVVRMSERDGVVEGLLKEGWGNIHRNTNIQERRAMRRWEDIIIPARPRQNPSICPPSPPDRPVPSHTSSASSRYPNNRSQSRASTIGGRGSDVAAVSSEGTGAGYAKRHGKRAVQPSISRDTSSVGGAGYADQALQNPGFTTQQMDAGGGGAYYQMPPPMMLMQPQQQQQQPYMGLPQWPMQGNGYMDSHMMGMYNNTQGFYPQPIPAPQQQQQQQQHHVKAAGARGQKGHK